MKKRELENLGVPHGPTMREARRATEHASAGGMNRDQVREALLAVLSRPGEYLSDRAFGNLAALLVEMPRPAAGSGQGDPRADSSPTYYRPSRAPGELDYAVWGSEEIDSGAHEQMRNACRLPVSVAGALMADAHVGYGLPIGGVLATENAVIPYAVGVDIACRVKLTVFDISPDVLTAQADRFDKILERETRFGVGGGWRGGDRPEHPVMDEDWGVTPVTAGLRDLAWQQLGTSGSGNHFVEFGEIEYGENAAGVRPGRYLAVVSHSGSRGTGAKVAGHYSRLAMSEHPNLPNELRHLAWLPMDGAGAEYWEAMELVGKYASANHDVIHRKIIRAVGVKVLHQVENHHNFAWKERHAGREVIVHRKGATPAGSGVLGYIPGSMTDPGYLVLGRGEARSLDSASHGAGRRLSRRKAIESNRWSQVKALLEERGVRLLSAGLDEAPNAYKPIETVMAAQADLVERVARFQPRIVKMAPAGEKPED